MVARRTGLGRGLDAILPPTAPASGGPGGDAEGDPDEAPGGADALVQELPVADIRPNPYQPRQQFDEEALVELTASIEAIGLLQPVLVRPTTDGYELVAGERRWRAAQRAGLRTIPALVRASDDQAALAHAVVENVQRSQLNAIEEAAAYQQLVVDFGLTQDEVAHQVGRSRSTITNTLRLLQLSPAIQRRLLDGELSAGHGRALLGTDDERFREELAARIVARGLSVREAEQAVRRHQADQGGPDPAMPGTTKPAALLELEHLLADRLATRVKVDIGRRKGRIEIEFADLEDLERIFRLIS